MHFGVGTLALALMLISATQPVRADVDYGTQVKPILTAHCTRCHGALKQKAALRLDAAPLLLKGGKHGEIIKPGKADESLLIHALTGTNGATRMPEDTEPLKPDEIAIIRQWIDEGAKAPADEPIPAGPESHWAFQPPVRPQVPAVKNVMWAKNPIDAFIAAEHEKRGLTPRPEAEKHVLLRRVTLDLIGLPPTREELRAFLADTSPDAYEKVVDRLLASPRYGERWGRHWMDVWRYSDWAGYGQEIRYSQPHIWRWRDWIIESLNADKPYDQMVREMLAGDEIAPADPQVVRATGFLARNWSLYNRNGWMEEVVEHTGKAFLGLTLNCAKCHDHFFDPISQREYYGFRAIFEPYGVRVDAVPGTLDTKADGLPRVFDANEKAETFLFVRGDDRNPKKDEPLAPTVPAVLGGTYQIAKVDLPPPAYYAGLRDHVRRDMLAAATAAIDSEEKALAQNEANVTAAETAYTALASPAPAVAAKQVAPGAPAPAAAPATQPADADAQLMKAAQALWLAHETVAIGKLKISLARAEQPALVAKIAADDAKYATPPPASSESLALAAGRAERLAAICKAELETRRAQHALATVQAAVKPSDKKSLKALADAGLKLVQQRTALEAAKTALEKPSAQYTPITPQHPSTSTGRRLALAQWLTRRDNPLPARVAVNHIWLRHFGSALVPSVFDFGLNGRAPTHPALLDWLAIELMDRGWSMKAIHRLMVTSATYRMRSDAGTSDESNRQADPDNIYLWRANVRRMEAEAVRDSVLAIAGQLDLTTSGPDLDHEQGLVSKRRSLYFRHAHEKQMTFLKIFDGPSTTECYRRDESVMPQQALALANNPLALAQSRVLASALTQQVGSSADPRDAFISASFEQVLCRAPSEQERRTCEQFLVEQATRLAGAAKLTSFTAGDASAVPPSKDPNQRARENLVHVLMNHNDFVTIR